MINKKILLYTVVLLMLTIPIVEAYQELHEPNIVCISYVSTTGINDTICMYSSVADTIMRNVDKNCFQELNSPTKNLIENKNYLLSRENKCNCNNNLFYVVLKLYEDTLKSPHESIGDMETKAGYVKVAMKEDEVLKYISIKVNKAKKIITELSGL